MQTGDAVICFVLANPSKTHSLQNLEARNLSLQPVTEPAWSPDRRFGYGAGLRACVQSLRRRHQKLPPVLLLRSDHGVTLADVDEVLPIDTSAYAGVPFGDYWGVEVYYKLDVFNVSQYERVVYLDCDTVVLDDISDLWDMSRYSEKNFYAVRETADMGVHPIVIGKYNTGVMVINRSLLGGNAYRRMLQIARGGQSYDEADQSVINQYLEQESGANPGELDDEYNVMVSVKKYGKWHKVENRIKILHYTNRLKPWAPDHHRDWLFDEELKNIWDEAYRLSPVRERDTMQAADLGDIARG
jgi:lipopolysaccharide biosynthesis glycosyltransferase